MPDLTEMHSPQGTVCSVPSTKAASANFVHNGTHLLSEESTKDRRAAQSMRREMERRFQRAYIPIVAGYIHVAGYMQCKFGTVRPRREP